MFPTVYMLWHVPDLLYTFTTHPQVFPIITGGADLMLPGVVLPEGAGGIHMYGRLQKNDRVAINLTSNKAPIAVGKAANSSHDMYMCARRGKCVEVLHYYGDQLSIYGTKLVIPELGPPGAPADEAEVSDPDILSQETEKLSVEDGEANQEPTEVPQQSTSDTEKEADYDKENDNINTVCSTTSMDDLLRYCFLKSLKTTMKKVELPLLTSNFYKIHMIPCCPKGNILDIKKSSYKKLSNFLEAMAKQGAIQLESPQKGVQCISKIDYNCDLIKDFVDRVDNEDESSLSVDTTLTNKSSVPEITEKYTVTAAVLPLFYNYAYKKKDAVTAEVVRKVTTDYVRTSNLQSSDNRKEVILDETLRSATNSNSEVQSLPWDQLMAAVFKNMGHSFKVEMSGNEIAQRGKLPPIDIQVGTRSGNKKVTLVNNLELYGINLTEFSRECQHGVAASTTINSLPSAKSSQLQIQGNQVNFVAKILTEKYQIPKRYLRGTENAPKKKK
ncbi:eukaryotic translation initiation factor 2D isoform X2 [Macrosteles quadrilineatus]|nr:eukaryotic translation initiation factor 2D isoform X2 [Macrosteles quadrilineatus]XP_054280819.1 eukaryotic translation initiation factor 2D isoform X2 [Macrosteles quadrilineatus]